MDALFFLHHVNMLTRIPNITIPKRENVTVALLAEDGCFPILVGLLCFVCRRKDCRFEDFTFKFTLFADADTEIARAVNSKTAKR